MEGKKNDCGIELSCVSARLLLLGMLLAVTRLLVLGR